MPTGVGVIDTMVGFPTDFGQYDYVRRQAKDKDTLEGFEFPVEYMFKGVPKELYGTDDPVGVTLARDGPRRRRAGHGRVQHRGRPRRRCGATPTGSSPVTTSTRTTASTSCAPS